MSFNEELARETVRERHRRATPRRRRPRTARVLRKLADRFDSGI